MRLLLIYAVVGDLIGALLKIYPRYAFGGH